MKNLLLLHGALGSEDQIKPLIELLSNDFNCKTFSFKGHGHQRKESFTIDSLAKQTRDFVNGLSWDSYSIFAYSMGGYVALTGRLSSELNYDKLLCLGTKFHWTEDSARREIEHLNPEVIKEKVPAFAKFLESRHGEDWEELLHHTKDMMLDLGSNPRLNSLNLNEIPVPVRISRGEHDKMVSRRESRNAAASLNHGAYLELFNNPHPFEQTDLKELASLIRNFL